MAYCQYTDLNVLIDSVNLAAMSNDYDSTQPVNLTVINSICQQASNACDAYVASIYATPFVSPPATIKQASIIFACEAIYFRRFTPEEKNPFKSQADVWRDRLQKIGSGMLPLDESFQRGFTPVVAKVYKSRIDSNIY